MRRETVALTVAGVVWLAALTGKAFDRNLTSAAEHTERSRDAVKEVQTIVKNLLRRALNNKKARMTARTRSRARVRTPHQLRSTPRARAFQSPSCRASVSSTRTPRQRTYFAGNKIPITSPLAMNLSTITSCRGKARPRPPV